MKWIIFIAIFFTMVTCSWHDQVQPSAYFNYSFAENENFWRTGNLANVNLVNKDNYFGGGFVTKNRLDLKVGKPFDQLHIMFYNFNVHELVAGPYWFYNGDEAETNAVSISFIDQLTWSRLYEIYLSQRTSCDDPCKSVFAIGDYFFKSVTADQNNSFFIIDKINDAGNGQIWISGSFQVKLISWLVNSPQVLNGNFHLPLKVEGN
ncbi:MAG: hypothetical protein ACOCVN_00240 [bacterium]